MDNMHEVWCLTWDYIHELQYLLDQASVWRSGKADHNQHTSHLHRGMCILLSTVWIQPTWKLPIDTGLDGHQLYPPAHDNQVINVRRSAEQYGLQMRNMNWMGTDCATNTYLWSGQAHIQRLLRW